MKKNNRIAEIDALRGVAVLAMVYYHLMYDLIEFYSYPFTLTHPTMQIASVAAPLFFILAGISSQFSRNPWNQILKLTLAAGVVTIVTYIQNPQYFVKFGTLHFLACSMLLLIPFKKTSTIGVFIAVVAVIIAGYFVGQQTSTYPWLAPLGFRNSGFQSSDYFPLLPNLAYPLVGLLLGRCCYSTKKSLFPNLRLPVLQWIGRHSLTIYLAHQPFLFALLHLLHK